jgi:hypothetical protein
MKVMTSSTENLAVAVAGQPEEAAAAAAAIQAGFKTFQVWPCPRPLLSSI